MKGQGKGKGLKLSWSTIVSWGKSKNLRIFVLCFFVALVFWGLKSLNKDYQTNINMPIRVVYNDSAFIPLDPPPEEIPMRVSGYGWDLIRWTFGWKIDPLEIEPDGLPENQLLIFPKYSERITGKLQDLKLVDYLNSDAPLNFDFLDRKTVPIYFDSTALSLKEGYYLEPGLVIMPDSLTFMGPKSLLENLQDHYTLSIPIDEIDKDFSSSFSVQFPHSELVSVIPEEIDISFPVGKWSIIERTIGIEIRSAGKRDPEQWTLSSQRASLSIRFLEGAEETAEFDSIRAYVSLDVLGLDSLVQVEIENLPKEVGGFEVQPDSVKVRGNGGASS